MNVFERIIFIFGIINEKSSTAGTRLKGDRDKLHVPPFAPKDFRDSHFPFWIWGLDLD